MNGERLVRLERAVEVALTAGVALSGGLMLAGLALGAEAPLRWGILLLMLTPVVRVLVVAAGLLFSGDWLFGAVSVFVLGVLGSGIWAAIR